MSRSVFDVFTGAMVRYARWFILSVLPGAHTNAPLGFRRLGLVLLFPVFLALQLVHWAAFLIDELFFPGYRKVSVKEPVFIIGIPRSGTTYLHRELSANPRFTTVSTWEALLAPAVCERKLLGVLRAIDKGFGGHLRRLILRLSGAVSSGLDSIHPVRLDAPEEDYLLLLPAGACSFLLVVFPFDAWLFRLADFGALSTKERKQLIRFYHAMLQKHLYCQGESVRLLSKNAAFSGWAGILQQQYPDAEFIVCTRSPVTALSSQLSALKPARRIFGTDRSGDWTRETFNLLFSSYYTALGEFMASRPPPKALVLDQADLRHNGSIMEDTLARRFSLRAPAVFPVTSKAVAGLKTTDAHVYDANSLGVRIDGISKGAHAAYKNLLQHPMRIGASR